METREPEFDELRYLLSELTKRVFRIEQALKLEVVPAEARPAATAPTPQPVKPVAAPVVPPGPSRPVSAASATNLESRIGSHWLNRIGIFAVLIGVSYFLKFAFENNWIGPAGRVVTGLLAGVAIVAWSERFRSRGYKAFSYSLKAVGVGVLYLSIWAGFQVYSLFPAGMAFMTMCLITASTAALALAQDAEILAALALMGGFATPLLLSTGENREVALFAYLGILDAASLIIVTLKPWRRLLVLSFLTTLLLYIGWYNSFYQRGEFQVTIGFASLFFAIFAIAPLLAQQPVNEGILSGDLLLFLVLGNAAVYFLQVYAALSPVDRTESAWAALGLAAVYIVLSRAPAFKPTDTAWRKKLKLLHLGIAVGFITIAIPIRLDGHWITIGWFVEAGVLLPVADRAKSRLLNQFALVALFLGVVRLVFLDDFYTTQLIWNARFATYVIAIAVLGLVAWYSSRQNDDRAKMTAAGAVIALNILALIAISREASDYYARQLALIKPRFGRWNSSYWLNYRHVEIARDFTYSALWMAYGALLMVVGFWRRSAFVRWQALVLIAITVAKVFLYDTSQLDRAYRILSFIALGVLLLAISFAYQRNWLQLGRANRSAAGQKGTA